MTKVDETALVSAFELHVEALAKSAPNYYTAQKIEEIRSRFSREELNQQRVEAWFNGLILSVRSLPGFGSVAHPDGHEIDVPPEANDDVVGHAVNEALSHSRELTLRDLRAEIRSRSRDELNDLYRQWLNPFMARHGYKTPRALFAKMLHVSVWRRADRLTFSPSNHDRLDGWSGDGLASGSDVVIGADSSPAAVGAALRLAFSRCLDTYGKKKPGVP